MRSKEIQKSVRQVQDILPSSGIWTVEGLAVYLELPSHEVMQKLSDMGIKVISFTNRYRKKLFRLEDLRVTDG